MVFESSKLSSNMDVKRPKIIFLTNMLNCGGAERSLLEVFRALNRQRFDPIVWRLDPTNMYPEYFTAFDSTKVLPRLPQNLKSKIRIGMCRSRLPYYLRKAQITCFIEDGLRLFDSLKQLMKKNSGPVVLVSSQLNMNTRASLLQWLCNYKVPVVFIEHNEPYLRYKNVETPEVRELAWSRIRKIYPRATHIITVSDAGKKSLVNRFGIKKKQVSSIPNPVDVKRIRHYLKLQPPDHPFYRGKTPVLVCVARFHPIKNHAMLLRSFAIVRQKTRLKLALVGLGLLKDTIQRTIAEMGLEDDVAVINFDPEPFGYIAHANLSILTSYSEGQGLAVIESLACGIPVVCTRWKGVGELIKEGVNGIICDMNDAALASGILAGLKLAKSKTRQTAATKSAEKFNTTNILPKYEKLLSQIALNAHGNQEMSCAH